MWVVSYPYVILLIFTTIYDPASAYNGDLHWVKFNVQDPVPDDAVVGGYESGTLYIVRAGHEGSMTPGKFSPYLRLPYIPWGLASHVKTNLEILCGRNYEWVSASEGSVPAEAFVGGRSENNLKETLYIGKAYYRGHIIPGKVQPSHSTMYIPYGDKEISIKHYDVLVVPQKKIPDIILDGSKTVIKGNSINIECKIIQGIPTPTITWEFRAKGSSSFVYKSGSSNVLFVGAVDAKDEGIYKCIAHNYAGEVYRTTQVTVLIPPTIFQSPSNVYTSVEGKVAQLQIPCIVTGSPKPDITWKAKPSATYSIQDGTLVIKNPKMADSGDYRCEARNNAGFTHATFKVVIHQVPKVSGTDVETRVKGQSVIIKCNVVKGVPTPTITWKFKAKAEPKFVSQSQDGNVLHISHVDVKQAGVYKCIAHNAVGEDEHLTTLNVQIPPTILSSSSVVYKAVEGTSLQIPCNATGLPVPVITWKSNGKTISSDDLFLIHDGILVIKKAKVSDSKEYTCEARNEAGYSHATFQANILQAPKLSGEATKTVVKGQSLNIECKVLKGVPKPTITWQFKAKDKSNFEMIAGSSNLLALTNVDVNNEGSYKCTAHNVVDTDEHVTALTVQFAPLITSDNFNSYGLEGDVALKIPCKVIGVPQPTITWKINSKVITSNAQYSIIDGALVIKDPKQSDSKSYTCEARNNLGLAKATFNATIDASLEDYGTIHEVNVLKGATTKLKCGSADPSQSIRWFLEGVDSGVKGQFFELKNVDETFDGNYTCRVSDINGAYTKTHLVIVGYPPEFKIAQDEPLFDYSGSENDDLDCDVNSKPPANVVWSYNGEVLSGQNSYYLTVAGDWGHYTCNVSNSHGTIQRSFDVVSSKCFIRRKPKNVDTMPLILSPAYTWPVLDSTTDYLIVEPKDTIVFSCPTFKSEINFLQNMSGVNEIIATCVKQDVFKVQDVMYKVSDLQCVQPVHSVAVNKHEKCLGDTSELVRVGYEVHGFLETYKVCFDVSKNMSLYSRLVMSKSNVGGGNTYRWHKYGALSSASGDTAHTCTHSTSSCCYTNTQLVNARDVSDGPPQKSTFIHPLNAVPLWLACAVPHEQSPWANIEDTVRSRLDSYDQFVVWSGTHKLQNINGNTIPRYLWKVVRFAADDTLAMIYVNGPSPSASDILCRNICADNKIVPWIQKHNDHTYCCQVDEFLSAFGLSSTSVGKVAHDNNISKK